MIRKSANAKPTFSEIHTKGVHRTSIHAYHLHAGLILIAAFKMDALSVPAGQDIRAIQLVPKVVSQNVLVIGTVPQRKHVSIIIALIHALVLVVLMLNVRLRIIDLFVSVHMVLAVILTSDVLKVSHLPIQTYSFGNISANQQLCNYRTSTTISTAQTYIPTSQG